MRHYLHLNSVNCGKLFFGLLLMGCSLPLFCSYLSTRICWRRIDTHLEGSNHKYWLRHAGTNWEPHHDPTLTIIPNPTPIQLKLDSTGEYILRIADVAHIDYDPAYTLDTTITPRVLTCADLGPKNITVTAQQLKPNPTAMLFKTSSFLLVLPNGDIVLSDTQNDQLRYISHTGAVTTVASGDGSPYSDHSGVAQSISGPNGLAMDSEGNIYVAETGSNEIAKITPDGQFSTIQVNHDVYGIAVDAAGDLFVSDPVDNQILKIDVNGNISPFALDQGIGLPQGMTIGPDGDLYVADASSKSPAIWKISPSGTAIKLKSDGLKKPEDVKFDSAGNFYIVDSDGYWVKKYDKTFQFISEIASDKNGLSDPYSVGVDAAGDTFVLDLENTVILKIDGNGKVSDYAGGMYGYANGNIAESAGQLVSQNITVNVVGTIKFKHPITDQTFTTPSFCPVPIPDYTSQASAIANCGEQITVTQNPVAGTPINDNIPRRVTVTAADAFGSKADETFAFTVSFPASPLITFPKRYVVLPGNSVRIIPTFASPNIVSYQWKADPSLSDTTVNDPIARPSATANYHLRYTTIDGCSDSLYVNVTVLILGRIPNTFTPNGDGVNDTWDIPGLADFPDYEVRIYNRNGTEVYSPGSGDWPWNGRYKGECLPVGPYYYKISPKNGLPVFAGCITIIR